MRRNLPAAARWSILVEKPFEEGARGNQRFDICSSELSGHRRHTTPFVIVGLRLVSWAPAPLRSTPREVMTTGPRRHRSQWAAESAQDSAPPSQNHVEECHQRLDSGSDLKPGLQEQTRASSRTDPATSGMVTRPGEGAVGISLQENLAPRGPCRWEGDSVTSRQTSNQANRILRDN